MRLLSLELENFLSHRHTKLDLDNRGLVLIQGVVEGDPGASSNGAGKSALLPDGLVWGLFGRTLRGVRGRDVVHRQVKKNCLVTVAVQADNGEKILIKRVQKHDKLEKPCIEIGNQVVWGADEVDKFVEDQLGLRYDTFVPTTIYGKGDSQFFTQLTDAARKEILEDLLGLGQIPLFEAAAKKKRDQLDQEHKQLEEQALIMLTRLEELRAKHAGLKQMAEQFEETKRKNLQAYEEAIVNIKTVASELQGTLQGYVTAREALEDRAGAIVKDAERLAPEIAEWEERHQQQVQAEAQLKAIVQERLRRVTDFTRGLEGRQECPTCRQEVTRDHYERCLIPLQKEADSALFALKAATEAVALTWQQVRSLRTQRQVLNEQLAPLARQVEEHEKKEAKLQSDAAILLERLKATLTAQRLEEGSVNTAAYHVAEAEKEVAEKTNEVRDITQKITRTRDEFPYVDFWLEAFSNRGIKSMLIDRSIPFLNQRAQHYSNLFTGGAIQVRFSTQKTLKGGELREKFDVEVESAIGGESYRGCSDGQRRRGDIICNLSLGDLAATRVRSPVNLAVLDEVFDGLDSLGIEMVMPLLSTLVSDRASVFVISHKEDVAAYFPTVLTVVNRGGFSSLKGADDGQETDRS